MIKIGEKIIKLQDAKYKLHANNSNEASIFITGDLANKLKLIENEKVTFRIEKEDLIQLLCFTFSFKAKIYKKDPVILDLVWFDKYLNLIQNHYKTTSEFTFDVKKQSQERYYFIGLEQPGGLNIRDIFIQDHIRLIFFEDSPRLIKIEFSNLQLSEDQLSVVEESPFEYLNSRDDKSPLNRILYGPPGTGKTYNAINHAISIINGTDVKNKDRLFIKAEYDKLVLAGQIQFVTFHQSYSYEEFVEGIKPLTKNGQVEYEIANGIFKRICLLAQENASSENAEKKYVLIIDEINRGNISRIFGELITLIEDSKRIGSSEQLKIKLAYSGGNDSPLFGVPNNLYIIGTMNSTDRSIALIDTALRRRFTFFEYSPDPSLMNTTIDGIDLNKLLSTLNARIEFLLDKDHLIGHAYFMSIKTKEDLIILFRNKLLPLLEEYFHGDYSKIQLVLGDNGTNKPKDFQIVRKKIPSEGMDRFKQFVDGFEDKEIYEYDPRILNYQYDEILPEYFKFIYE
jgi:hypothetical protein